MTTTRRRTLRQRLIEAERERNAAQAEAAGAQGLGPADVRAIRETADDVLQVIAGTTAKEAAVAIALCNVISPLLLRSGNPYGVAVGSALQGACRIRRAIRRRT